MFAASLLLGSLVMGQLTFADVASRLADEVLRLAPPIEAKIIRVSSDGILIDAGEDRVVIPGTIFEVYHRDPPIEPASDAGTTDRSRPIGEIVARRVFENTTLAEGRGLLLGVREGDEVVSKPRWCKLVLEVHGFESGERLELIEQALSGRLHALGLMGSPETLGFRSDACQSVLYLIGEVIQGSHGGQLAVTVRSGDHHIGEIVLDTVSGETGPHVLPASIDTLAACVVRLDERVVAATGVDCASGNKVLCVAADKLLVLGAEGACLDLESSALVPSPVFTYQRDPAAIVVPFDDGPAAFFHLSSHDAEYEVDFGTAGQIGGLTIRGVWIHEQLRSVPGRNYFEIEDGVGELHEIYNMTEADLDGDGNKELALVTREGRLKVLWHNGVEEAVGGFGFALCSGDIDGDGIDEIITTSDALPDRPDSVRILKHSSDGWALMWESPVISSSISALASTDIDQDARDDIAIFIDRSDHTQLVVISSKDVVE